MDCFGSKDMKICFFFLIYRCKMTRTRLYRLRYNVSPLILSASPPVLHTLSDRYHTLYCWMLYCWTTGNTHLPVPVRKNKYWRCVQGSNFPNYLQFYHISLVKLILIWIGNNLFATIKYVLYCCKPRWRHIVYKLAVSPLKIVATIQKHKYSGKYHNHKRVTLY